MKIRLTSLDGVLLIEPNVLRDERGLFLEVYHRKTFRDLGIGDEFVQSNQSRSASGVLRGFHYQDLSAPQAKLVRCTAGRIFDVAVDLRVGSPGFGGLFGSVLTSELLQHVYISGGYRLTFN